MTAAADPPRDAVNVHRRLGRYELLERLALSSTAEVHLARPSEGGQRVAIKRLLPHALEDPELRAHFDREIEASMSHNHPGLVRGIEVIEGQPGEPCLVMAYVEGPTLAALLAETRGPAPEDALTHAASALATTLEALHAHREGPRAHGDLSARNVVADRSGGFTFLDLGSSAPEGDGARDAGTPRYVCPERREHPRVTTRGDVYSVGVLLWELATGRRWPTDTPPDEAPSDTPVGALIGHCIAADPAARPSNAAAIKAALEDPSPQAREAWLRWTGRGPGDTEASEVSAAQGGLAWAAIVVTLIVAAVTAAWTIG